MKVYVAFFMAILKFRYSLSIFAILSIGGSVQALAQAITNAVDAPVPTADEAIPDSDDDAQILADSSEARDASSDSIATIPALRVDKPRSSIFFTIALEQISQSLSASPEEPHVPSQISRPLINEVVPGTGTMTPEATAAAQRPAGFFEPFGIRLESFLVKPRLDVDQNYNSNIFATDTNTIGDWITSIRPSLSANSDWSNHAFNFVTSGDIKLYRKQTDEDFANVAVAANGRIDVLRNVYVTSGLGFQTNHEERTSPDSVLSQTSPTRFDVMSVRLGFVHDRGRIAFRIESGIDSYQYFNGITQAGEVTQNNIRSRVEYKLMPRVSFKVSEGYYAFVQGAFNKRSYSEAFDPTVINRSSEGFEIDGGAIIAFTGKASGEAFVGYVKQDYTDALLSSTSSLSFGGNLQWEVTPHITVRGVLSRLITETTIDQAAGYIQTRGSLSIDYLFRNNLVFNGALSHAIEKYQGVPRLDRVTNATLTTRYFINRYLIAGVSAAYKKRAANVPGSRYGQYLVTSNLRLQF